MGVAARVSPPPAFTGARGRAESVAANADLSCWNRRAVASELDFLEIQCHSKGAVPMA
jgi:hypothetical protein